MRGPHTMPKFCVFLTQRWLELDQQLSWGPRSNDWKMCGKPPGAKHYFFARRMACA
jgi:hypothetical protein